MASLKKKALGLLAICFLILPNSSYAVEWSILIELTVGSDGWGTYVYRATTMVPGAVGQAPLVPLVISGSAETVAAGTGINARYLWNIAVDNPVTEYLITMENGAMTAARPIGASVTAAAEVGTEVVTNQSARAAADRTVVTVARTSGIRQVGSAVLRVFTRVVLPIALAYDVGKIGAAAIGWYGDKMVASMTQVFACAHRDEVRQLKEQKCGDADAALSQFQTDFCSIDYSPATDNCGNTGAFNTPPAMLCDPPVDFGENEDAAQEFADNANEAMGPVLEQLQACFIGMRLLRRYDNACLQIGTCQ